MTTVKQIYEFIDNIAPFSIQITEIDNAGRLVGREDSTVTRCMVTLDITPPVARQAAGAGCELVVSHHPVIFFPARTITEKTTPGEAVLILAENRISAICAHTNLDRVRGGVNDRLAETLGLQDVKLLRVEGKHEIFGEYGIGRWGYLPEEMEMSDFCAYVKRKLGSNGIRYASCGKKVRRVAVAGGVCRGYMADAMALDCDAFVTADLGYNDFLDARDLGLNLIDAGHFPTENPVIPCLRDRLAERFPDIEFIIADHGEVIQYM